MILRWRPSPADLEQFVDGLVPQPVTYEAVGATLTGELPRRCHHERLSLELGAGDAVFAAGRAGLEQWKAHRGVGFEVVPHDAPLSLGTDVAVVAGLGPVRALIPCRVVEVVDQPDRFGFAYGTLPGHPVSGEESFVVHRAAGGTVRFEVTAFSRPANVLTKLGGPVATKLQSQSIGRYLTALRSYVSSG